MGAKLLKNTLETKKTRVRIALKQLKYLLLTLQNQALLLETFFCRTESAHNLHMFHGYLSMVHVFFLYKTADVDLNFRLVLKLNKPSIKDSKEDSIFCH